MKDNKETSGSKGCSTSRYEHYLCFYPQTTKAQECPVLSSDNLSAVKNMKNANDDHTLTTPVAVVDLWNPGYPGSHSSTSMEQLQGRGWQLQRPNQILRKLTKIRSAPRQKVNQQFRVVTHTRKRSRRALKFRSWKNTPINQFTRSNQQSMTGTLIVNC